MDLVRSLENGWQASYHVPFRKNESGYSTKILDGCSCKPGYQKLMRESRINLTKRMINGWWNYYGNSVVNKMLRMRLTRWELQIILIKILALNFEDRPYIDYAILNIGYFERHSKIRGTIIMNAQVWQIMLPIRYANSVIVKGSHVTCICNRWWMFRVFVCFAESVNEDDAEFVNGDVRLTHLATNTLLVQ